ncbi:hypothetical protein SCP_0114940 [Sparassis crispa]|uniref:Uncharacterized protein n=1 Tax=Sparassis crispa TaxID=139825 RepID=A0A401G8V8_9APHY|nr:hypothetical protein SCP_0114940 [Sparassis crispa]GBE78605.1 hypothetical protein SCP_0114940 [Sparassis crispa]
MEHQKVLIDEADNDDRESPLYHAIDWGLNFNALRTTIKGKRISVHPQAELEIPGKYTETVPETDRALRSEPRAVEPVGQLQEDMTQLSINSHGDDNLLLNEEGSETNVESFSDDGSDDSSRTEKPEGSPDSDDGTFPTKKAESSSSHDKEVYGEEEKIFSLVGSIDSISAQLTDAGDSATTVVESPKSKHRRPDFITLITFPDKHRRVLFIHEVKPLNVLLYTNKQTILEAKVSMAFRSLLPQIIQQVQFGFEHYPDEDILYIMGMVQFYFCIYRFYRRRTPKYGEPLPQILEDIPEMRKGPYSLFNKTQTDYHSRFKYWWTRVRDDAT